MSLKIGPLAAHFTGNRSCICFARVCFASLLSREAFQRCDGAPLLCGEGERLPFVLELDGVASTTACRLRVLRETLRSLTELVSNVSREVRKVPTQATRESSYMLGDIVHWTSDAVLLSRYS